MKYLIIILVLIGFNTVWSKENVPLREKKWTIMVYMNGDNSLNDAINIDADELEAIGSDDNINIVIQTDGYGYYGGYNDATGYGNTNVRRYYIEQGDTSDRVINSSPISVLGELDMCDPKTIGDFVVWAIRNYPAQYYWLVLWDHGEGWTKELPFLKDYGPDETNSNRLSIAEGELREALALIQDSLGRNLDVLGFDACLMATFGVAYDIKDFVDIYVASEEFEGGDGWEYDAWLDVLKTNPNISPAALSRELVESYIDEYLGTKWNATMAAMDVNTQIINLTQAIDKFAYELIKAGGRWNSSINTAKNNTERYSYWNGSYWHDGMRDLYDFATNIINQNINPDLNNAARSVQDCFGYPVTVPPDSADKFLIYQEDVNTSYVDSSHGVWIYYPNTVSGSIQLYKQLEFSKNTLWDEFISGKTASDLPSITNISYRMYSASSDTDFYYTKHISGGDNDGIPDPGEQNSFYLWIWNTGGQTATSVSATLSVDHPLVTVDSATSSFPNVPGNFGVVRSNTQYYFTISSDAKIGEWIDFEITLSWSGGTKTSIFPVQIGKVSENVTSPFTYVEEKRKEKIVFDFIKSYPIPFNSKVTIRYFISTPTYVTLKIYDLGGRLVKELMSGKKEEGEWSVEWDGRDENQAPMPNGVYFCRLKTGGFEKTKKLIIIQ